MECQRCATSLSGKQQRWCSPRCSKLGLKALYKQRNSEKIREHRKQLREKNRNGFLGARRFRKNPFILDNQCKICGSKEKLSVNHIIPRSAGGKDELENLETLCMKCNLLEYKELVRKSIQHYFDCPNYSVKTP